MKYPSGRFVSYGFDAMGRTNAILKGNVDPTSTPLSASTAYLWGLAYTPHGAWDNLQYGTSSPRYGSWTYNFRLQRQLSRLGQAAGLGDLWNLDNDYGSDNANTGNVQWQYLTPGSASTVASVAYSYDAMNRLQLASEKVSSSKSAFSPACPDASSQWCFQYGFDAYGNRTITQRSGSGTGTSLNEPPGYVASTNRITGGSWQYDTRGNITQDGSGAGMVWDAENRLQFYCPSGSAGCGSSAANATQYFYDGDGKRVQATTPAGTTVYVYDASGNLAAEYGPGTGTSGTKFLVGDHLESTRAVMDAGGAISERIDYFPYGDEVPASAGGWRAGVSGYGVANSATKHRFTAKERDAESGLDYFGARYMSSAQGRFMSPDPLLHPAQSQAGIDGFLSEPQRWNKYAYVSNNPLKYVDPNGAEQVVSCINGTCYNNITGRVIPSQSNSEMLRTAAIPLAGVAASASGSWLASSWFGQAVLGYFLSPSGQETAQNVIGALSGSSLPGVNARTSSSILNALSSSDPAKQLEGIVGRELADSGLLKEFDVNIAGRQIDAVAGKTGQFVVEVTTGSGRGKIAQGLAQMRDTGMEVVIYGEALSKGFIREAQKQGLKVARDLDELKKIVGGQ